MAETDSMNFLILKATCLLQKRREGSAFFKMKALLLSAGNDLEIKKNYAGTAIVVNRFAIFILSY